MAGLMLKSSLVFLISLVIFQGTRSFPSPLHQIDPFKGLETEEGASDRHHLKHEDNEKRNSHGGGHIASHHVKHAEKAAHGSVDDLKRAEDKHGKLSKKEHEGHEEGMVKIHEEKEENEKNKKEMKEKEKEKEHHKGHTAAIGTHLLEEIKRKGVSPPHEEKKTLDHEQEGGHEHVEEELTSEHEAKKRGESHHHTELEHEEKKKLPFSEMVLKEFVASPVGTEKEEEKRVSSHEHRHKKLMAHHDGSEKEEEKRVGSNPDHHEHHHKALVGHHVGSVEEEEKRVDSNPLHHLRQPQHHKNEHEEKKTIVLENHPSHHRQHAEKEEREVNPPKHMEQFEERAEHGNAHPPTYLFNEHEAERGVHGNEEFKLPAEKRVKRPPLEHEEVEKRVFNPPEHESQEKREELDEFERHHPVVKRVLLPPHHLPHHESVVDPVRAVQQKRSLHEENRHHHKSHHAQPHHEEERTVGHSNPKEHPMKHHILHEKERSLQEKENEFQFPIEAERHHLHHNLHGEGERTVEGNVEAVPPERSLEIKRYESYPAQDEEEEALRDMEYLPPYHESELEEEERSRVHPPSREYERDDVHPPPYHNQEEERELTAEDRENLRREIYATFLENVSPRKPVDNRREMRIPPKLHEEEEIEEERESYPLNLKRDEEEERYMRALEEEIRAQDEEKMDPLVDRDFEEALGY